MGTVTGGAMRIALWSSCALATALMMAGCSGGGGGTGTPSTPTNQAPSFTSAAAVSVSENNSVPFYTAIASDPEGAAITYAIAGGADAASFTLAGNQLKFVAAPNFDLPGDADGNNVYQVQLSASDGQASSTLNLAVTVDNSREGIAVRRVGTGFVDPVAILPIPGDTQLFVVERGGNIYKFNPTTGDKALFQALSPATDGERGVRAMAVAPDYATSGRYFVLMSLTSGSVLLTGCRRSGTFLSPECNDTVDFAQHDQTNNYGAFMGYGPDGKLYVATGDGGGSRDPANSAQNDGTILGKLLRVDNNPDPYAGAAPQYFIITTLAKGLHNPRGGGFHNGKLLLGDRGESTREEINLVSLAAGGNFGWPAKEGTVLLTPAAPTGAIDPVIEYPHVSGSGVVGGVVYRGSVTSLKDQYVFADQGGTIYSAPVTKITEGATLGAPALEQRAADFTPDSGTLAAPVAFGEDNQRELYIVTKAGEIFRVTSG